ncbi:MAG: DUF2182 domain-containing protein [Chloroflexia bacterium]|nr:DUF2182 domain-containing protein [Chloroflexia bacterium]
MSTIPERTRAVPVGSGSEGRSIGLLQRGQAVLLITLVLLTMAAWGLTVYQAGTMGMPMGISIQDVAPKDASGDMGGMSGSGMEDMAEAGWSPGGLAAFVLVWAVMMVAMMLPAVAPMLLLYRTVAGRKHADGGAFISTWVVVAGYLLVWTAVGLGAYALVRLASNLAGRLGDAERQEWAPLGLGAILIISGLYQFTPLKRMCLRQCQSPFGFVMGHWRDGRFGALRLGIIHGAYCFGCCWALFTILVAAGVMSIAWMLLLTLVVFAEKALPHGQRTAVAVGLTFVALGVLIATGTMGMPWIT